MDPHSGAGRKAARQVLQSSATFARKDEAQQAKKDKPFPPKAKRLAIIFSVILMALISLPAILEATDTQDIVVNIGPWLTLLISLPITLLAMALMGFLRDGLTANLISGAIVLLASQIAYGTTFGPEETMNALVVRTAAPAVTLVVLFYFWISLKSHLRDIHYMIAEGESMQDIMTRMQQAQVIKKAGGEPVLDEKGRVVDKNDLMPRKGFRQKKGQGAKSTTAKKKKRRKPKVR